MVKRLYTSLLIGNQLFTAVGVECRVFLISGANFSKGPEDLKDSKVFRDFKDLKVFGKRGTLRWAT